MTRNITHFGETGRPNSIIGAVPLTRTAQQAGAELGKAQQKLGLDRIKALDKSRKAVWE